MAMCSSKLVSILRLGSFEFNANDEHSRNSSRKFQECPLKLSDQLLLHRISYQFYQYVPHKAVAEVSKIAANYRRLVAVNHASQSTSIDGSKSGWRQRNVYTVVVVGIVVALVVCDASVVGVVVVVQ